MHTLTYKTVVPGYPETADTHEHQYDTREEAATFALDLIDGDWGDLVVHSVRLNDQPVSLLILSNPETLSYLM